MNMLPAVALGRRRFLGLLAGGAAAAVALAACGDLEDAPGAATATPNRFVQPESMVSSAGALDVTLRAAPATLGTGSTARYGLAYNGVSPGPTIVVRPGDRLTITLENALDRETNLHVHGLHVSPSGTADEVFTTVASGAERTYVYDIPADHRSGMFWYHPHVHGDVAAQVAAGMFGVIVVLDAVDDLDEIKATSERIMVLSDPTLDTGASVLTTTMPQRMLGRQGDLILVNGVHQPQFEAGEGRLERWRLLNASASRFYRLAVDDHQLQLVATDCGRVDAPRPIDELLLAPGERAEVLIAAKAGTHALRALPYDRGTPMSRATGGMMPGMSGGMMGARTDQQVLATLVVSSGSTPALPAALVDLDDVRSLTVTQRRELTLAMSMGGMMGGSTSSMPMGGMGGTNGMNGMDGAFTINGVSFDAARTDIAAGFDSVEEWTITNTSNMDHPFHLHTWPFQVVATSSATDVAPAWKDTVNVPAGRWVRIRIPIRDFTGRTVYHCHILDHEDLGMMGVIEVS